MKDSGEKWVWFAAGAVLGTFAVFVAEQLGREKGWW